MKIKPTSENNHINIQQIKISTKHINVNNNLIANSLNKQKPSQKFLSFNQHTAYDLPKPVSKDNSLIIQINKNTVSYPRFSCGSKIKNVLSSEQLDRLVNLQQQFRVKAYNQFDRAQAGHFRRNKSKVTIEQFIKINPNTANGQIQRNSKIKQLMSNVAQKFIRQSTTSNTNNIKLSPRVMKNDDSQQTQSIEVTSYITSPQQVNNNKNKQKVNKFNRVMHKKTFEQIYNSERRFQTWKSWMQVQRNKIGKGIPYKVTKYQKKPKQKTKMKQNKFNRNEENKNKSKQQFFLQQGKINILKAYHNIFQKHFSNFAIKLK